MSATPHRTLPVWRRLSWSLLLLLLFLGGLIALGGAIFSPAWLVTAGTLPVALHSFHHADYSADLRGFRPLAFGLGLVGEAARDLGPSASPSMDDLRNLLQTPVPTVTPFPTLPDLRIVLPTFTPTQTRLASAAPPATATSTGVPSFTPSATPSATFTASFSPTPTASLQPLPTRRTPSATATPFIPTPTRVPPTSTSNPPTSAPPTTAPPTATPAPPSYPPPPESTQPPYP